MKLHSKASEIQMLLLINGHLNIVATLRLKMEKAGALKKKKGKMEKSKLLKITEDYFLSSFYL